MLETLTQAGLLERMTPEQLFVSVQDAAAHALERLVRVVALRVGAKRCWARVRRTGWIDGDPGRGTWRRD